MNDITCYNCPDKLIYKRFAKHIYNDDIVGCPFNDCIYNLTKEENQYIKFIQEEIKVKNKPS